MSERTLRDYKSYFDYLLKFWDDEDISRSEMTRDLFREYISWMLYEQGLSPITANVQQGIVVIRDFFNIDGKKYDKEDKILQEIGLTAPSILTYHLSLSYFTINRSEKTEDIKELVGY